ncbi:hypothetical protein ARMSODRAFT_979401 [Armillaria solidipes]|uniref:Uncharacterized protein n=1 Tax=Armillaria solidipes TaxID=1076256 RepID=A0A2H3AZB8_9AGAR|nr:hypothetical protein ARMSODRAFT_979401 [Armillaria solidipes]
MTPFYIDAIIPDGSAGAIVSDLAVPAAYLDETYPSQVSVIVDADVIEGARMMARYEAMRLREEREKSKRTNLQVFPTSVLVSLTLSLYLVLATKRKENITAATLKTAEDKNLSR